LVKEKRSKSTSLFTRSLKIAGTVFFILVFSGFMMGITTPESAETAENCGDCHEEQAAAFKLTPHGAASCSGCHGDAGKHIEEGGGKGTIFAFGPNETPMAKSKRCIGCHKEGNVRFFASPHGKASMDCTGCHMAHPKKGMAHKTSGTRSCLACHEDVVAQFKLNERHRLQEGILECTTCHNPHEPALRERLAGFKHETCLKCHSDKGGPFLYEHAASRIEGCSACHEVHGSANRHMLHHQSVGELCFSCHGQAPAWHARFQTVETNCAVCHSTIHGSNLSHLFLK
jgi:DmsE family decaheme c-type cytochrome